MSFHQKLYIGLLWDFIHTGHKLCAYRIHIVESETFEGICFEKYSEGLRYLSIILVCLCFILFFLLINIENIQSLLLVSLLIFSRYAWL